MVWRLESHGLEGKVWQFAAREWHLRVRNWHFEGAKVALRGCETGTSGVRKWHFGGAKVAL